MTKATNDLWELQLGVVSCAPARAAHTLAARTTFPLPRAPLARSRRVVLSSVRLLASRRGRVTRVSSTRGILFSRKLFFSPLTFRWTAGSTPPHTEVSHAAALPTTADMGKISRSVLPKGGRRGQTGLKGKIHRSVSRVPVKKTITRDRSLDYHGVDKLEAGHGGDGHFTPFFSFSSFSFRDSSSRSHRNAEINAFLSVTNRVEPTQLIFAPLHSRPNENPSATILVASSRRCLTSTRRP